MANRRSILVTGSAGRIGQAVVTALKREGFSVRGFDRVSTPQLQTSEQIIGRTDHSPDVARAFEHTDTLIHLAATPDDGPSENWFKEQLLGNNILGTYEILEAARCNHVKTLFLASTGQVNWFQQYEGPLPIKPSDPVSPRHWYAATKMFMESAGQSYVRNVIGSCVLSLRLGWCPRFGQEQEFKECPLGPDVYLGPKDAGDFFVAALNSKIPAGYHCLFVTSRPTRRVIFDLGKTRELTGWEPTEQWSEA